jgi:WD40 repeat protein
MSELFRIVSTTILPYRVSAVAWSPDAQWIAAAWRSSDQLSGVAVLDPTSGTTRWHVGGHPVRSGRIIVAPDGQRIAASSVNPHEAGGIRVFDSRPGTELWSVPGSARSLVFSPDSSLLAYNGWPATAPFFRHSTFVDADTGSTPQRLGLSMATPAFSSDSRLLCNGAPDMYDSRSGRLLWHLGGDEEWNSGCAFSNDDQDLIHFSTRFRRILVYDAQTATRRSEVDIRFRVLSGTALSFADETSIVFSPDRTCVGVLCRDGVGVYSVADGTARFEHRLNFHASAVTPDLRLAFRDDSSQIAINWTLADSGHLSSPAVLVLDAKTGATVWKDATDVPVDIAFSNDGSLIVAGGAAADGHGFVRVYETGVPVLSRRACDGPVHGIAVSAAKPGIVAATSAGAHATMNLFRGHTGELIMERTHPGVVTAVAVSTDGRSVATASSDGLVRMFDVESGLVWKARHRGPVNAAVFSADGRRVATASSDRTARLYDRALAPGADLDAHQPLWTRTHPHTVTHIALSADGRWVATACVDRNTRVLDAATGNELHAFEHDGRVRALTASSTGILATANDDGTVLVIDGATGGRRHRIDHQGPVMAAALSSDGSLLATQAALTTTQLWSVDGERPVLVREQHHDAGIIDLAFHPVDNLLAVVVASPVVRVIEPVTGIERYRVIHPKPVRVIAFGPDGNLLVTGCDDNIARVFDVASRRETR